jgi:hypothetical protein
MRTVLKILGGLLLLGFVAAGLWWWESGTAFLYGQINPDSEALIGDASVPAQLDATAWREDLDSLVAAVRRRHPDLNAAISPGRFSRRVDSVAQVLPGRTRDQRLLSLMHLLNFPAPGTGHSGISPLQRPFNWQLMPLQLFEFADGYYVVDAINEDWVGNEVLTVGDMPIDSVTAALAPYVSSDNAWSRKGRVRQLMLFANPVRAIGAVDRIDEIPVRMRTEDGTVVTRVVEPGGIWSLSTLQFSQTLQRPVADAWSPARTQPRDDPYRLAYRDSTNLLYLRFNSVRNASDDWTIADLADSLRHVADMQPFDKVVLDLRVNGGGNNQLVEPLVEAISGHPTIDRRGVLYTLLSRETFSAAGSFASALERRTKTLFAGEPSGFAPNQWGDTTPFLFPNSNVTGEAATRYWQGSLPGDPRSHIAPDIRVPLTSHQHFAGVDSTMIAVREHTPAPRSSVELSASQRQRFVGTYRLSPLHLVRIADTEAGLHLCATGTTLNINLADEGPAVFLDSDLHPRSSTRLATDVSGAFVERTPGGDALTLVWKDTTYTLSPVDAGTKPPIEHLRVGNFEAGARGLRAARGAGMGLDNGLEFALTRRAYALHADGDNKRALRSLRLAAELFPTSRGVQYRLGRAYQEMGQSQAALREYRAALALDPLYEPAQERLRAMGTDAGS